MSVAIDKPQWQSMPGERERRIESQRSLKEQILSLEAQMDTYFGAPEYLVEQLEGLRAQLQLVETQLATFSGSSPGNVLVGNDNFFFQGDMEGDFNFLLSVQGDVEGDINFPKSSDQ